MHTGGIPVVNKQGVGQVEGHVGPPREGQMLPLTWEPIKCRIRSDITGKLIEMPMGDNVYCSVWLKLNQNNAGPTHTLLHTSPEDRGKPAGVRYSNSLEAETT